MPEQFSYGEATVIPDKFIVNNCGDYALKQLEVVIDKLIEKNAKFMTARDIVKEQNW